MATDSPAALNLFGRWAVNPSRFDQLAPVVIAAAGIFEINPEGTEIRFALSSIALIFYLLAFPKVSAVRTGIKVACFILIGRIILHSYPSLSPDVIWLHALDQIPGSLYYIFIGVIFQLLQAQKIADQPAKLVFIIFIADISANLIELVIRERLLFSLTLKEAEILVGVTAVRDLWITAVLLLVRFKQMASEHNYKRKQLEKTLMLISGFYGEAVYLTKTIETTENVMSRSYSLYNLLKNLDPEEKNSLVKKAAEAQFAALEVTQQVHEIKKDAKRILAGMSKIIDIGSHDYIMSLSDLIALVIRSNENVVQNQDKRIEFITTINDNPATGQVSAILNILNNLVANSIDAIEKKGIIEITVDRRAENIIIAVKDNGIGISPQDLHYIFKPGFTTKYNQFGQASTGIGLSHVTAIVKELRGTVDVLTGGDGNLRSTCFTVCLPYSALRG